MESHLTIIEDEFRRRGMTPGEARVAAKRAFGGVEQARELHREQRSFVFIDHLIRDVSYALRTLRKSPAFVVVAIVTLAIGIGTATATFSQVNALFWKPLPVEAPAELRILSWTSPQQPESLEASGLPSFSYAAYENLRTRSSSFSDLVCWARVQGSMVEWGRFNVTVVTGNYFRALGVQPLLGRTIVAEDDRAGSPSYVAVLSYRMWHDAFNADPGILNRSINIKGSPFQIIGVMPEGFVGIDPVPGVDVIVPHAAAPYISPFPTGFNANSWSACRIFGRLRAGFSNEDAREETEKLFNQIEPSQAKLDVLEVGRINTLETQRQRTSVPLIVSLSAAGGILVIACSNIAGLLLARGQARRKEISTRLALGAPRTRIVRQLLIESLLVSLSGGMVGTAAAYAISPLLPRLLATFDETLWLNQTVGIDMAPDLRVVGFSIGISVLSGLAFGLLPALRAVRAELTDTMRAGGLAGRFRIGTGRSLVCMQVALSILLLVGAGLFVRTLLNLSAVPLGYEPSNVLFVNAVLDEPAAGLHETRLGASRIAETVRELTAISGVGSASVSPWPLYHGGMGSKVCVPSHSMTPKTIDVQPVRPRYFETWGVRLLRGHDFVDDSYTAVVVNERFARTFFGGVDPLGKTIGMDACPGSLRTIVGVVADNGNLPREQQPPMVYVPYPWESGTGLAYGSGLATYAIRTSRNPESMVPVVRRFFEDRGTNVVGDVTTGMNWKDGMVKRERSLAALLVFFGTSALLMSCLGVYGMLAYSVTLRTSEIGVRMTLGAGRNQVIGLVIRESLLPVAVGIGVGLTGAVGLTRWVETFLFGVSKYDPVTFTGASFVLLLTAAFAVLLPARRAARIDPVRALRYD